MSTTRSLVRRVVPPALGVALLVSCSDAVGPDGGLLQVREMSLDELGQRVVDGPARVDIALRDDGVVARRIAVKTGDELGRPELLVSAVTGISVHAEAGTLSLAVGATVTFDVETEFPRPDGAATGFAGFVASVTEALSLGREPRIKASRPPAGAPQAPDDPAFHATAIRLLDEPAEARLVLNLDRDNLAILDQPPPDASLTVLGLPVEVRVTESPTELVLDQDERDEVAFEGLVSSVRVAAGTFALVSGDREIAVQVVDRTRLWLGDLEIESLELVVRALEAGQAVRAVGEGVVQDGDRPVLALVVRFTIRDGRTEVAFGGRVRDVDQAAGLVMLVEGPTVKVGPDTRIAVNGAPVASLGRVAEALEAGLSVFAFGEGVKAADSDVVAAAFIRFQSDGGTGEPERVAFAGRVGSVNLDAGSFTLVEGPTVLVSAETTFAERSAFPALAGVAGALSRGLAVYVEGSGVVVAQESGGIAAAVVAFSVGE